MNFYLLNRVDSWARVFDSEPLRVSLAQNIDERIVKVIAVHQEPVHPLLVLRARLIDILLQSIVEVVPAAPFRHELLVVELSFGHQQLREPRCVFLQATGVRMRIAIPPGEQE